MIAHHPKNGTTLILVDIQNDFHPGGSLAIPTANMDAKRIADLIRRGSSNVDSQNKIDRIIATMDSHHKLHIAHPGFWVSGDDESKTPQPFTIITSADVKSGIWTPRKNLKLPADVFDGNSDFCDEDGNIDLLHYCVEYTRKLEDKGRFKLCIWPEHCIIGSKGHCVVEDVHKAMEEWSSITGGSIEWVMKGQHLLTEMYSAFAAEVPITQETSFNTNLYNGILRSERVLIAGQASSHCVNYTTRDIMRVTPKNESHKFIILRDCMSAVPGFESAEFDFLKDAEEAGLQLCNAADMFVERTESTE